MVSIDSVIKSLDSWIVFLPNELREKSTLSVLGAEPFKGLFLNVRLPLRPEMESRRVSKAERALLGKSPLQLMKSPRPDAL